MERSANLFHAADFLLTLIGKQCVRVAGLRLFQLIILGFLVEGSGSPLINKGFLGNPPQNATLNPKGVSRSVETPRRLSKLASRDVRFTPESGHAQRGHRCPLSAKSGPAPSALVPHTVGGTIAVAAVCNGRMGCEPHSARAGILQQTGNLLAAKPDCFQRCVKFAPQMKKNRAIAAPACAPLGMDAFTRAQYEWGCGLPRRSHSPRP